MSTKTLAFFALAAAFSSSMRAASITVVPNLFEGKFPMIEELMPDGNSIMGVAGNEIYRWTPSGGRESVGLLGPEVNIFPSAISADGSTIVGRRIGWYSEELVRWTASSGVEVLATTNSHPHNPYPKHISDNGSVMYGTSYNMFTQPREELYWMGLISTRDDVYFQEGQEANFRWDGPNGFEILPGWHPSPFFGQFTVQDVSADGEIVAGMVNSVPTIWSEETGFRLPSNLPTYVGAIAYHLSADGTTSVGAYNPRFSGVRAFRWRVGGEIEPLTDGTEIYSHASLVSSDGRTILGLIREQGSDVSYDFIWREGHGLQKIVDYFAEQSLVIPFAGYQSISEMSRDGLVFRGSTNNPTGVVNGQPTFHTTRWIVDLRHVVPEPDATRLAMVAVCIVGVGVRARRKAERH